MHLRKEKQPARRGYQLPRLETGFAGSMTNTGTPQTCTVHPPVSKLARAPELDRATLTAVSVQELICVEVAMAKIASVESWLQRGSALRKTPLRTCE